MPASKKTILIRRSFIVITSFFLYRYSNYFYATVVFGIEEWGNLSFELRSSLLLLQAVVLAILAKFLISEEVKLSDFGLSPKSLPKAFLFSVLFIVPIIIGLGFYSDWKIQLNEKIIYKDIILAGFGEEFIYRAFLFGLLFYFCGWGFLSASILSALFFGWGHLYQANDVASAISIFLFTAAASVGFCWFYYAWKSLWMLVFLHGFMDLIWSMFQIETDVTGNVWINLARFSTLIIAILISIKIAKTNQRLDLLKNKKLWLNTGEVDIH